MPQNLEKPANKPKSGATASSNTQARIADLSKSSDFKSRRAVTIENREPEEIYRFWRDFANLPVFMKGLSKVTPHADLKSHWEVRLKSGYKASWDAEIVQDEPGRLISWRSLKGSEVETDGLVHFTKGPGEKSVVVSLAMNFAVPGGKLTELVAHLTGENPDSLAQINLHRLKAYMETGEIPTTEGQSSGRDEDNQDNKNRQDDEDKQNEQDEEDSENSAKH